MGIIFDEKNIVEKDNVPVVIPRDANFDPMSLLGGFDDTNTFRFAQFTTEGKLKVDTAISIDNVDIGDVNIRVKSDAGTDLLVSGGLNPDATTKFLYCQDQRMHFNLDNLQVRVEHSELPVGAATENTLAKVLEALGGQPEANRVSEFGTQELINGIPGDIVTWTVPAGKRFRLMGVRGWGDVDAEFYVTIGVSQVDGYRTTPANLTMDIDTSEVQYANAGEVVHLGATHLKDGSPRLFKGVIQGTLENA